MNDLTDKRLIEIKHKLTDWGLLDPRFKSKGDPRVREEHSEKWHSLVIDAYEKFLELFGQYDEDGLPDLKGYDFLMNKGEPSPIKGSDKREAAIARLYKEKDWYVARGTDSYNILFAEDMTRDWKNLRGQLDAWDDVGFVWQCQHNGTVRIIEQFNQVTTEPGKYYTFQPCNINGAARIAFGQYKAYQYGMHGSGRTAHYGLRQEGRIRIHRDLNKDGSRVGDKTMDGVFYCNHHSTTNSQGNIGRWSAGCTVFRYMSELRSYLSQVRSDRRYQREPAYFFMAAYVGGDELVSLL